MAALSCNDCESHKGWIKDIDSAPWCHGHKVTYPIIADESRDIAKLYGMIDPDEKTASGLPLTCRSNYQITLFLKNDIFIII